MVLDTLFNSEYFGFLLELVGACAVAGVLIPFGFWAVGSVLGAAFRFFRV